MTSKIAVRVTNPFDGTHEFLPWREGVERRHELNEAYKAAFPRECLEKDLEFAQACRVVFPVMGAFAGGPFAGIGASIGMALGNRMHNKASKALIDHDHSPS